MLNVSLLIDSLILCLAAAASPGPNLFMTMANTMEFGRKAGIMTALGVALGVTIWLIVCGFGISFLILEYQWLTVILNLSAASFLFYIGVKIIKNRKQKTSEKEVMQKNDRGFSFFRYGLTGTILNGSVGLFYATIFARIITYYLGYPMYTFLHIALFNIVELIWFVFVAIFVSTTSSTLQKYSEKINLTLGIMMIYYAIRTIFNMAAL